MSICLFWLNLPNPTNYNTQFGNATVNNPISRHNCSKKGGNQENNVKKYKNKKNPPEATQQKEIANNNDRKTFKIYLKAKVTVLHNYALCVALKSLCLFVEAV